MSLETKKLVREILALGALSFVLGAAVNFSLLRRFFDGDFRQSFLDLRKFEGIRFITLPEAQDLFSREEAVFIDSRDQEQYSAGHIPGALSLPLKENQEDPADAAVLFPPGQCLVVYCEGGDCQTSIALAKLIQRKGFKDIRIFAGGWEEWTEAGLPVNSLK